MQTGSRGEKRQTAHIKRETYFSSLDLPFIWVLDFSLFHITCSNSVTHTFWSWFLNLYTFLSIIHIFSSKPVFFLFFPLFRLSERSCLPLTGWRDRRRQWAPLQGVLWIWLNHLDSQETDTHRCRHTHAHTVGGISQLVCACISVCVCVSYEICRAPHAIPGGFPITTHYTLSTSHLILNPSLIHTHT